MASFQGPLQLAVEALQKEFPGPGGASAVLKDGEVVAKHVWGFADIEKRIKVTSQTIMPICSITKHLLCQVLVELAKTHEGKKSLWDELHDGLCDVLGRKLVEESGLTIEYMCNNASGIRDYWAMSVLWGARPDDRFSISEDVEKMKKLIKSFHFQPGTEYSYCNTNFCLVARILENVYNESFESLAKRLIFERAGMHTASISPDTARAPPPCVGYEGTREDGFMRACNRIEWSGDAGAVVCLDDMIAYEKHVDRLWHDKESAYRFIATPRSFKDGTSAVYGYGLGHSDIEGKQVVGHGGALRGYRLYRLHAPEDRCSVIILFNHDADSGAAAKNIMKKALGVPEPPQKPHVEGKPEWKGNFLDQETQLAIVVQEPASGKVNFSYEIGFESATLTSPDLAESTYSKATINGDSLVIQRILDNRTLRASRLKEASDPPALSISGKYYCEELESTFHCTGQSYATYGYFDGCLGQGPVHLMRPLSDNVWLLSCPRGLDAPAPGDWTLVFSLSQDGSVQHVNIGCWLARNLLFKKID